MTRRRPRLLVPLLVSLLAAYAGICALLYVFQGRLVYFPGGPPGVTPGALGLAYEEVELVAEDGVRLHAWLMPAEEPRGALLFCHGNAGNVEGRIPAARAFTELGFTVLLFDYRGYGASEGSPSEEGTYLDALAAYEHLVGRAGFDPDRIVAYGESLGAAVAIELARRRGVAGLVLEHAFTSLPDLGAELYRWLPVRMLARIRYDNVRKLAQLRTPVMIVHSKDDEIVPVAHAERLSEVAGGPLDLLFTRGGHNGGGFLRREEWIDRVRAFLAACVPLREG